MGCCTWAGMNEANRILADRFVETMEAIKRVHPYEEPVINAIPLWGTGLSDRNLKA